MDSTVFTVLLVSGVLGVIVVVGDPPPPPYSPGVGKHVYIVNSGRNWFDAQAYCRQYYTDLSSVGSAWEEAQLQSAASSQSTYYAWIGLYRDGNSPTQWSWSGGGPVTYLGWQQNQPSNYYREYAVAIRMDGWHDYNPYNTHNFFCVRLIPVAESKTWEEAMEYCKEHYTNLASLLSATEVRQAQTQSTQSHTTTPYRWTGLVYLSDTWLWVNGDPMKYSGWPAGGGQLCPAWNFRCGAIGPNGYWDNRDCQESLNFICY
ncbi:hypothetical protein DPEC_G00176020 [Dallia pectoralis]|uniref:Uncharacterized protein n=1 Tax=Dallia pectoralis TaxID=75939 RepID=A0ACC2GEI8_DALPE|nr:hypothetical protein DPEC_G00176020 [Dallia pectoralis]